MDLSLDPLGEDAMNFCHPHLHTSRRSLLGAGTAGLAAIAPRLARAAERQADPGRPPRSVILLWMEGGPSQLDTFDPHPGSKIGGDVVTVDSRLPGVRLAESLQQTAGVLHHATLVRSVVGVEGDHERAVYHTLSGFRPDPTLIHPSIGAVLCEADDRGADIPRHVSILPGPWPGRGGYLGGRFDAFQTGDPAQPVRNVKAWVDEPRLRRRLRLLREVAEPQFARGRSSGPTTMAATTMAAARRMMSSDQLAAFDVQNEPAAVRGAFGETPFGRGTLAAARLIEVGVRCVEVTLGGWDSHVTNDSLQKSNAQVLDPALASLITRLADRGLLDDTLVVCAGEFGRTPTINPAGGRDHWPHGFSVLMAGLGLRRGYVHGATSPQMPGEQPADTVTDPLTIAQLHATILHALGLDPGVQRDTPVGRPMYRSDAAAVSALLA